jgi:hypothetical protein
MITAYQWLQSHTDQANAVSASAGVIVAFLALLIAAISAVVSIKAIKLQSCHNEISVRPLLCAELNLIPGSANLSLYNHGLGPCIIKKVAVSTPDGSSPDFRNLFAQSDLKKFRRFVGLNLNDKIVHNSKPLLLILLEAISDDSTHDLELRKYVIETISVSTISVHYTDLYNNVYDPYEKDFEGVINFVMKNK